ncbi:MAG: mechanosensitive ion channel family protein [Elusimicrobia bacterium]|nr:mechanosensitive ion channel family protein [Elusimicrobiota bacterium]
MNPELRALLSQSYFGNDLRAYLTTAATFVAALLALYALRSLVLSRLKKLAIRTQTEFDDLLVDLLSRIGYPDYLIAALYFATRQLKLSAAIDKIIVFAFAILLSYRVLRLLQASAAYLVEKYAFKDRQDLSNQAAIRNIKLVVNAVLWGCGAIFVFDNLGFKVTTMVAGLGIGGVAIALAAQNLLGDLFSSFIIYADKPFRIGDFIIVGELMGVVEYVGIKTTRIQSLDGEQIVFSNSDLTQSRIRNFQRMVSRRVSFEIHVPYETPSEKLKMIPEMTAGILQRIGRTKLDRVHFKSFGGYSLVFEIVYYVLSSDYNVYMDSRQQFNFALKEGFEKAGINFAVPTQTVRLAPQADAPAQKN